MSQAGYIATQFTSVVFDTADQQQGYSTLVKAIGQLNTPLILKS